MKFRLIRDHNKKKVKIVTVIRDFFKFSESEKWSDFGRKYKKIQTDEDVNGEKPFSIFDW